jgi:uncharacterized membrane protein YjfL (UPF0719 family)
MTNVGATRRSGNGAHRLEEPDTSLGELIGRLAGEVGELAKLHVELVKEETKQEAKATGKAAGMLTGGAFTGYLTLILLSFAAAWGLAEIMAPGLAFLIVGVVWAVVTAVLVVLGRKRLQELEPAPTATIEEIQEDKQWLKKQP